MKILPVGLFSALIGLLLAACQPVSMSMNSDESVMKMAPTPGEITIAEPWARPSPMATGNGAAFLTVLNGLERDVQFSAVESPAAEVVELHETVNDEGVLRMIPQEAGFTIPAGDSIELKPGGKHVMLINLVEQLVPGEAIELTLYFDNGDIKVVTVPVLELGDDMPMGHDNAMDHTP